MLRLPAVAALAPASLAATAWLPWASRPSARLSAAWSALPSWFMTDGRGGHTNNATISAKCQVVYVCKIFLALRACIVQWGVSRSACTVVPPPKLSPRALYDKLRL